MVVGHNDMRTVLMSRSIRNVENHYPRLWLFQQCDHPKDRTSPPVTLSQQTSEGCIDFYSCLTVH